MAYTVEENSRKSGVGELPPFLRQRTDIVWHDIPLLSRSTIPRFGSRRCAGSGQTAKRVSQIDGNVWRVSARVFSIDTRQVSRWGSVETAQWLVECR